MIKRARSLSRFRTSMLGLAAVIGISIALAASPSTPPANAGASSCSSWGNIPYVGLPTGYMCFTVKGEGLTLTSMRATWRTATMCNWRFDWVIYYRGKAWWTSKGPTNGCNRLSGGRVRSIAKTAPDGSDICAILKNSAQEIKIAGVCFGVHR